jgi:hypothetical protein
MVCMHFTAVIATDREAHDDATRYVDGGERMQPQYILMNASGEFPMRRYDAPRMFRKVAALIDPLFGCAGSPNHVVAEISIVVDSFSNHAIDVS